jgi:hypothetical protein
MRVLLVLLIIVSILNLNSSCKNSSGPATFCDTACLTDSIKYTGDHSLKPWVYITASKCAADTIAWSYEGMGVNRKIALKDLLNNEVKINPRFARAVFNDTAAVTVLFNDCETGRGYQLKLPFNKQDNIGRRSSGINGLDPKFSVDESLVAYTDRGNIYVEEILTGKTAMMTFGEALDIDYDAIHDHIDSVYVTPERIWVKVKVGDEWKVLEKKIVLEEKVQ